MMRFSFIEFEEEEAAWWSIDGDHYFAARVALIVKAERLRDLTEFVDSLDEWPDLSCLEELTQQREKVRRRRRGVAPNDQPATHDQRMNAREKTHQPTRAAQPCLELR
jgi:hypothetical protein